ncbi:hypothetical protein HK102_009228 [Quaeritorhiza haematococci]|nr:hypothetical protein HK102_009228 [Quaeritorhiza haematococci]
MADFHDKTIWDLYIPGSHSSGSYSFQYGAKIPFTTAKQANFFHQWAKTQKLDFFQAAWAGIRFFDLRVGCPKRRPSEPWLCHLFHAVKLRSALQDIRRFVEQYPSEIVILHIEKSYDNHVEWSSVAAVLQAEIGQELVPLSVLLRTPPVTIEEIVRVHNKHIIVIDRNQVLDSFQQLQGNVVPQQFENAYWSNKEYPTDLEMYIRHLLSDEISPLPVGRMHFNWVKAELTPSTSMIVAAHLGDVFGSAIQLAFMKMRGIDEAFLHLEDLARAANYVVGRQFGVNRDLIATADANNLGSSPNKSTLRSLSQEPTTSSSSSSATTGGLLGRVVAERVDPLLSTSQRSGSSFSEPRSFEFPSLSKSWSSSGDSYQDKQRKGSKFDHSKEVYERLRVPTIVQCPARLELNDVSLSWIRQSAVATQKSISPASAASFQLEIRSNDWIHKPKAMFQNLASLTVSIEREPMRLISEGLHASSEDDELQTIAATLDDNPRTFWSSKGSDDMLSSEHLTFKLIQPVCIISSVEIIPYKARYQRGMPIYAPRYMTISVGFHSDPNRMHFVSGPFPVENSNVPQVFNIKPVLVGGGYVRLDLYGRYQTQPGDNLWYTVLQSVKVNGIALGAAYEKPELSSSLIRFANLLRCDWLQWGDLLPDFAVSDNNSEVPASVIQERLQQVLRPYWTARKAHTEGIKKVTQLLKQRRWKRAAKTIAREPLSSDLRKPAFLQWYRGMAMMAIENTRKGKDTSSRSAALAEDSSSDSSDESANEEDLDEDDDEMDWHDEDVDFMDFFDWDDLATPSTVVWSVGDASSRPLRGAGDRRDSYGRGGSSDKGRDPLMYFIDCLVKKNKQMTSFEALALAKHAIQEKEIQKFWQCLINERFECTEELGDIFRPVDVSFALSIYSRANVLDKIIECLLHIGEYYSAIRLMRVTNYHTNYQQIFDLIRARRGIGSSRVSVTNGSWREVARFVSLLLREVPTERSAVMRALNLEQETDTIYSQDELQTFLYTWAREKDEKGEGASSNS